MTRRPAAHRLAEHLIRRACHRLPCGTRNERYLEWVAELPAILHDPSVRFRLLRSARALSYAAGTYRSARYIRRATAHPPGGPRRKASVRAPLPALRSVLGLHPFPVAGISANRKMLAAFTNRATASIFLAQAEARRLGHDHIDPEHILLGLIHEGQGVAVKSLTRLGIDLDTLRRQVEESTGHGPGAPPGPIRPSRPRGMKVLNSALPEALGHGHNYIGTEHLLLAQFHDDGPAAQALARLGASESEVRAAITTELSEFRRAPGETEATPWARVRKDRTGEEETERLRREVDRLRDLLLRHGIEPSQSDRPTT